MPLPLAGLRILAAEQLGAGPFGTMLLADLGAEVIKIEDPAAGGDSARQVPPYLNPSRENDSLYFQSLNRNKKSLTLNLRSVEGQAILHRLAATADVMFNNLRGDLPEKLGLTYRHLSPANARIVCVSCSAYGTHSSMAAEPGYDYLFQGRTGMMALTGEPDGPPTKSALSMVDFSSGLTAMIGLLAAVHAARRDGIGRDVDVSLLGTSISVLSYLATWALSSDYHPQRLGRSQHPSLVPVGVFRTRDGWIILMCMKQSFFERLCEELGRPELLTDPRFCSLSARLAHRAEVNAVLDQELSRGPTEEWLARLRGKLPCGPIYSLEQALQDPLVEELGMIWEVDHPEFGAVRQAGSPITMTEGIREQQRRAPFLGEDTETLLREVGIGPEEAAELRQRKII